MTWSINMELIDSNDTVNLEGKCLDRVVEEI